jgi:hypothetical protein
MNRQTSTASSPSPIIVYGQDKDRFFAGYFKSDQAAIATKAAESLKFKVAKVDSKAIGDIAGLLKPGRPHESGKAFLPPVSKDIFGKLAAAIGGNGSHASKGETEAQKLLPSNWVEIRSGSLLIAQESAEDGWW